MLSRQCGGACFQRRCQPPCEPVLEHPNASNRSGIAKFPVPPQLGFFRQWQLLLKTENHPLERLDIFRIVGSVASEMDIDAAPTQLSAEIPAGQKFVGPD